MGPQDRIEVRSPNVISEITDGEAVIIDLDSGTYYSLDAVGSAIWAAVEQGATVGELLSRLGDRFDAPAGELEAGAVRFLERLRDEGLVTVTAEAGAPPDADAGAAPGRGREAFADPVLSRFTDIKDLLLLDPVHEVDEDGWPNAARPRESGD